MKAQQKKFLENLLFVFILFLFPFFLLTYNLTSNPPGFFIDESIHGYEAYYLFKTKGFSSTGEFLPRLFLPQGSPDHIRNHGAYPYLIVPFIGLFGYNEFSVRFPSVISSLLLLSVLYIILRKRVSKSAILLCALCWPFMGWVFLLSRMGMELIVCALVFTGILYLLLRIYEAKQINTRLVFALGLSTSFLFYIYAAGKLLALMCMLVSLIILFTKKSAPKHIFLLLGMLFITYLLSFSYIRDGSFFYMADDLQRCQRNHCFVPNILTHFNLINYFGKTFIPPDFPVTTHSITNTSLIPQFLLPFFLVGLGFVLLRIRKRDHFSIFLLLAFIMAIIPASLTSRGFDSYRSAGVLPLVFIVITLGVDLILRYMRKSSLLSYYVSCIVFLLLFLSANIRNYQTMQQYTYNLTAAKEWHYGYRQIFSYITHHYNEYQQFAVTDRIAYVPKLYIHFFDPEQKYSKITVGIDPSIINKHILYVLTPEETPTENFIIKKIIYFPDKQNIAYYIGEMKNGY